MSDDKNCAGYCTLLCAMTGLARTIDSDERNVTHDTWRLLAEGLMPSPTEADEDVLAEMTRRVHDERARLVPQCALCASPCGRNSDCSADDLRKGDESLKQSIFDSARAIAASVAAHDAENDRENRLLLRAIFSLGEDWDEEYLRQVADDAAAYTSAL